MTTKKTDLYECDECGSFTNTDPNLFRKLTGNVKNAVDSNVSLKDDKIYCVPCFLKMKCGIIIETHRESGKITWKTRFPEKPFHKST